MRCSGVYRGQRDVELVKENRAPVPPLSAWWLAAALGGAALLLGGAALAERALPAPRAAAPPQQFSAARAAAQLARLTAAGPRVAGSPEADVLAVRALLAELRALRAAARAHRLLVHVHAADGAFPLAFLDGLNNAYRGVRSVVARVSPAGAGREPCARTALLLNCHFDTVPDSPGASDDAAGCAVLLETLRALLAGPRLPHDVVFLFNGAEENILQASHAFITTHRWARCVRAFVNLEACGAGGREVLFQAGPHDPWLLEEYAAAVPYPFASSLAQELFESGVVPADTDFRIFRDFGNLSGLDLAWSANGYVYHTPLDTAERVPLAALQRTGDNVLALTRGLLASAGLRAGVQAGRAPAHADVLGLVVLAARAPAALGWLAATLLLVLAKIHLNAAAAKHHLGIRLGEWWGAVGAAGLCGAVAGLSGVAAGAGVGLALHCARVRLAFYGQPWLLAPLYALPALGAAGGAARAWWRRGARRRGWAARGWWAARAAGDAAAGGGALAAAACALAGLRSGFVPLLWALPPALADLAAAPLRPHSGARAWCWAGGAALPALQTWYLALGVLRLVVPLAGRAGSPPLPPDAALGALVAVLTLLACSWLLPLLLATRDPRALLWGSLAAALAGAALAAGAAPYGAERPQRLMVFHTRRTDHSGAAPRPELSYWLPELDVNMPDSLYDYVPGLREAAGPEPCTREYCGAPYYLPAAGLVHRWHRVPTLEAPLPRLSAALQLARLNASTHVLDVHLNGTAHVVVVVSPAAGLRATWASVAGAGALRPQAGHPWGARRTYFFTLHDARRAPWHLRLWLEGRGPAHGPRAHVSAAAHALYGPQQRSPAHARLLAGAPPWAAATGWGVDLHLYTV